MPRRRWYKDPTWLGKTQLKRLKREIILDSPSVDDYANRYGIPPMTVKVFFDGYVFFLYQMAKEDGFLEANPKSAFSDVVRAYDDDERLAIYAKFVCPWGFAAPFHI